MELSKLVEQVNTLSNQSVVCDHQGHEKDAYDRLDKIHDLLLEEFVPMERPECESSESS